MLTISNNGEQIPLNFDDYYIQEIYGGKDAAGFTLPLDHPDYQYLFEETPLIDTETKQRYLIPFLFSFQVAYGKLSTV